MKQLAQLLRRPLIHVAAFSLVVNLLLLIPAIFMLQVFDRVLVSRSGETLVALLLGTAVALLILLALEYLRGRLQGVAGNLVAEALSPAVARVTLAAKCRGSEGETGEGLRDVATLRSLFSAHGLLALFDAPWFLVYVAVIWLFHPVLGIAAAVSAGMMALLALLNDRLTRSGIEKLQRDAAHSCRYLETSMANAEVAEAMGMGPLLVDRWREMNRKVNEQQRPIARTTIAMTATTRALRQAIQVCVLAIGAYLVITQQATVGIMIATTILLGRALAPVEQIVGSWRVLADGRAALARLRVLLAADETAPEPMPLPMPKGALVAHNIIYRPAGSDRLVLQGVSLQLAPGESLAIIGPSAAGKSTLARVLIGLWKPTAGIVRLDGADLSLWPRETLGPAIGYVPQDVELFNGTVADNIARLGPVDPALVVRSAQRAHVHDMILSLPNGYDTRVDVAGKLLSPGQRQRIALARALYGDPRLVVLDEPNSNLDGVGEQALGEVIRELQLQAVTVVVITHRNTLIRHVGKMLVLENGRVQHFGATSQVLEALHRQTHRNPASNVVQIPRATDAARREHAL